MTRSALQGFLDEIREGSLIIERNLARSAELIGSFKQLAVDQTSYQRRPFELKELAHEVLTTLRPTLRKMPFVLRDELCENVRLDSYPGPLGQVLINLVNNALTHAFAGRQEGAIWLRGHIEEGMVHVSVSDDGIGMMPEQLKKIFDPFYTTQLGKGGSGLGLHIVYTLVNGLLGGRIEVRSTPGSGTCFTLILPRVAP
ncbi:MAG: sensor histidine kinase [Thiopseudomonas sp.]